MTPQLLEELEAKARAATPGPWLFRAKSASFHHASSTHPYGNAFIYPAHDDDGGVELHISDADAAHIASASPDVVLALVAEVRRLRGALFWYADQDARWFEEEVISDGTELACGEGKCLEPIPAGTSLGYAWRPRVSTQADHGKRARDALTGDAQ